MSETTLPCVTVRIVEHREARGYVRYAFGFMDWRPVHPEPDVIDLEPRIEVFHGQPRTVWSP